jgi:hypothetical protein
VERENTEKCRRKVGVGLPNKKWQGKLSFTLVFSVTANHLKIFIDKITNKYHY